MPVGETPAARRYSSASKQSSVSRRAVRTVVPRLARIAFDGFSLVLKAHTGKQFRQRRGGHLVVLDDGFGLDIGQGKQEQGNQPGAVTPGTAVEQDASRSCAGQRADDCGASLGLAFQKGAVVERCAVELLAVEALPKLDVVDVVKGNLNAVDAARDDRGGRRHLKLGCAAEPGGALTRDGSVSSLLRRSAMVRTPALWAACQPVSVTNRRSADLMKAPNRVVRPVLVGRPPRSRV
jgi:hypothetical protein